MGHEMVTKALENDTLRIKLIVTITQKKKKKEGKIKVPIIPLARPCKSWSNGLASSRKLKTWVSL